MKLRALSSYDGDQLIGWVTESGDAITADTVVEENLTVHAVWQSEADGSAIDDNDADDWFEESGESWYD